MPVLLVALALAAPPATPTPRGHPAPVTMDLQAADVRGVLQTLADQGGVNLVLGDEVRGTVTLRFDQAPWADAFAAVLAAKGLTATGLAGETWVVRAP